MSVKNAKKCKGESRCSSGHGAGVANAESLLGLHDAALAQDFLWAEREPRHAVALNQPAMRCISLAVFCRRSLVER